MDYDLTLAQEAYDLASRWDASRSKAISSLDFKSSDLDSFDSNQKSEHVPMLFSQSHPQTFFTIVVFLERLQSFEALPPAHIAHLGKLYSVCDTTNAEIRYRFYEVALLDPTTTEAKSIAQDAAKWVVGDDGTGIIKGRMKFCRPVFRAVNAADKNVAVKTFEEFKLQFHPIARRLIEKVSQIGLI